jgi:hypothetical protein
MVDTLDYELFLAPPCTSDDLLNLCLKRQSSVWVRQVPACKPSSEVIHGELAEAAMAMVKKTKAKVIPAVENRSPCP